MKRQFALVIFFVACIASAWFFRGEIRDAWYAYSQPALPVAQEFVATVATSSVSVKTPDLVSVTTTVPVKKQPRPAKVVEATTSSTDPLVWIGELPKQVNLAVPFLSQAPKKNWSMPYQEACEEAAAIMVDAYYRGRSARYAPDEGDRAVLATVAFEEAHGIKPDMDAKQTAMFIKEYFGYDRVSVRPVTSARDIQTVLAQGFPVMVPAYGKALGNPNFRNNGPLYHMLVIKGYLPDGRWITNDPGTRLGEDYVYAQDAIMRALHDWNGGDVQHGNPMMIVVIKQ